MVKPFSSSGVMEELEGLRGVCMAKANPFEDLVD